MSSFLLTSLERESGMLKVVQSSVSVAGEREVEVFMPYVIGNHPTIPDCAWDPSQDHQILVHLSWPGGFEVMITAAIYVRP